MIFLSSEAKIRHGGLWKRESQDRERNSKSLPVIKVVIGLLILVKDFKISQANFIFGKLVGMLSPSIITRNDTENFGLSNG